MLQDAHTKKISITATAPVGTTVIVDAVEGAWIYVHELIGDLGSAGDLTILAGTRELAKFSLDAGQGITEQDEPGEDNSPRFECRPGEDFKLTVTGGTFQGSCHYSLRY
jgi:hypothetical protein